MSHTWVIYINADSLIIYILYVEAAARLKSAAQGQEDHASRRPKDIMGKCAVVVKAEVLLIQCNLSMLEPIVVVRWD